MAVARPAPSAPPLDFVLGDWLVQPGLNRLSRNGTARHVRPQLMDILVCLAGASGRPVPRDEIMSHVWPGQLTVTESAVARCIAELRHALDDQAMAPTLIETIHKRGYRVIAPVAAVEDRPPSASAPASRQPGAPSPVAGERRSWIDLARLLIRRFAAALAPR